MNKKLNIALVELDIAWCDKKKNLSVVAQKIANLSDDIDLVILPELFSTGFINDKDMDYDSLAEKNTGETIRFISHLAQQYHIAIIGSFLAKTSNHYYNRGFFIEPTGEESFYDKRHLFSMADENKYFTAGMDLPPIIRFRGWNIMPIICYDLRFPTWCRNMDNKYDILIVIANWPSSRVYAWKQLLIGRAIENECYVCGVNRTGKDDKNIEYPDYSSMIIDFKGQVGTLQEEIGSHLYKASLDMDSLKNFRKKFPTWNDADKFRIEF